MDADAGGRFLVQDKASWYLYLDWFPRFANGFQGPAVTSLYSIFPFRVMSDASPSGSYIFAIFPRSSLFVVLVIGAGKVIWIVSSSLFQGTLSSSFSPCLIPNWSLV